MNILSVEEKIVWVVFAEKIGKILDDFENLSKQKIFSNHFFVSSKRNIGQRKRVTYMKVNSFTSGTTVSIWENIEELHSQYAI